MVFGTILSSQDGVAPKSSYSIDGGSSSNYTGIQLEEPIYRQLFFDSGHLTSSGQQEHTITIESLVDNGLFILDFVNISTTLGPASTTIHSLVTTTTSLDNVTPTTSQFPETKLNHRNNGHADTIVAAIVPSMFFIGLIIKAIIYRKRKDRAITPQFKISCESGSSGFKIQSLLISHSSVSIPTANASPATQHLEQITDRQDVQRDYLEIIRDTWDTNPVRGSSTSSHDQPSTPPPEYERIWIGAL